MTERVLFSCTTCDRQEISESGALPIGWNLAESVFDDAFDLNEYRSFAWVLCPDCLEYL